MPRSASSWAKEFWAGAAAALVGAISTIAVAYVQAHSCKPSTTCENLETYMTIVVPKQGSSAVVPPGVAAAYLKCLGMAK